MKSILLIISSAFLFTACIQEPSKDQMNSKRREITSYIETSFILRDTTSIKTMYAQSDSGNTVAYKYNLYNNSDNIFLNTDQFKILKGEIMKLMYQPSPFIFNDIYGKPLTSDEIRSKLIECDSINESSFNSKGEETIKANWYCDSTSIPFNINLIKYYEALYFNTQTKILEKDVLGYTVFQFEESKRGYRELFTVVKNQEAVEVLRKKWKW